MGGQPTNHASVGHSGLMKDAQRLMPRTGGFTSLPMAHLFTRNGIPGCGNFQNGHCPVRDGQGQYFHITGDGSPAYPQRYRYVGDFRDGIAVVQRDDGKHTHIDTRGNLLHNRWFLDLDVYHKGHARARDEQGWLHVNLNGEAIYSRRFTSVEPFYNGQARVEWQDGSLSVIDESGVTILGLRAPLRSSLEELSGDMVGHWRTQVIRAAVEVGVFEALPASGEELNRKCGLASSMGGRLLRALQELGLVNPERAGQLPSHGEGRASPSRTFLLDGGCRRPLGAGQLRRLESSH